MSDWRSLTQLTSGISCRNSSYDRTGGNDDYVSFGPGETYTILEADGTGVIQHIWITIDCREPHWRKNLVIRAYWDGQEHPSVESPIGDFFGNGWGEFYNFSTPFLACAPRQGRAMVCYFPMPFANGARITIENQGEMAVERLYYYVDYEKLDSLPANTAYFHAWYNQELTTPENAERDENEWFLLRPYGKNPGDANNYLILNAEGQGHFMGMNYYVGNPGPMWYGEGDDMFMIDGQAWPGLHGTGTEDYFNTSWSPDERFDHPAFGLARIPGIDNNEPRFGWMGRTHCYRFHQHDPIRFQKSLRASIEHGHDNCLTLELATVAYWYQSLPTKPFPSLAPKEARIPRPIPSASDVHRWRDAFMKQRGGTVWGSES
ncbi:MAG: DUF2961 domain-containing protein [Fimbriimonadaceae bacterium]|nr:MAG: DUF2961 domain-containing protein [Fimbriimonadaceae bacterium]